MSPTPASKRVRVLIVLALLAIAGAGGWLLWRREQRAAAHAPATFHGNVDIHDVTLAFRVAGRVQTVEKHEGDAVTAGETLAHLDPAPYQVVLDQARAALEVAEAELARVVAGSRREDIAEARAQVHERRASLRRAEDTLKRYEKLGAQGVVTQQALLDARAAAEQGRAAEQAAQASLARVVEGSRAEDVAVARAQVGEARARVAQAELQVQDTALVASESGTLVTRAIEPGSVVSPGTPALVVSLDDPVWIRAFASETQLAALAPGTPVEVFVDARPARPYRGQVGYVASQAEFTPKNVETAELRSSLVYRFRVIVSEHDGGLRQGMPTRVRLARRGGSDGG